MPSNESKLTRTSLNDIAPNNSDKAQKNQKAQSKKGEKLKPIVKTKPIKQKRTVMMKFKESFFGDTDNIGDYIIYDVLVPAFRGTLADLGVGVVEQIFGFGPSRRSYRGGGVVRDRGKSYISYNSISNDNHRGNGRDLDRSSRARHDFDNVIFASRGEAEDVLSHLVDMTIEYGEATVRHFYELSNIEADFTDDRYGWTNLRDAYVDRTRNGHVIVFPPTRPL